MDLAAWLKEQRLQEFHRRIKTVRMFDLFDRVVLCCRNTTKPVRLLLPGQLQGYVPTPLVLVISLVILSIFSDSCPCARGSFFRPVVCRCFSHRTVSETSPRHPEIVVVVVVVTVVLGMLVGSVSDFVGGCCFEAERRRQTVDWFSNRLLL